MRRYSGRKRKGYISRTDRVQNKRIKVLEQQIILKEHTTVDLNNSMGSDNMLIVPITLIPQGETDITREGSEAILKSWAIRWSARQSVATTTNFGIIRVMVYACYSS